MVSQARRTHSAASTGALLELAREILFTFCPFPEELRQKMGDNPQYRDLIKKHETQCANKKRPITGLINRLQMEGTEVPPEIRRELEFLEK